MKLVVTNEGRSISLITTFNKALTMVTLNLCGKGHGVRKQKN